MGGLLAFAALTALVVAGVFGPLPTFEQIENPKYSLASEVYDRSGKPIGRYFIKDRAFAEKDEISPWVFKALIATEDVRFYSHAGIDPKGVAGAIAYTLMGKKRGGSTITQQLAKNLFPREDIDNLAKLIIRKLKEWVIAVELERSYSKDEILTMYLNVAPFGGVVYGIKSASETYFGIPPSELKPEQAALLIGMLKATTLYNPVYNPDKALARRNTVLERMAKAGFLTRQEADSLKNLPIEISYTPRHHAWQTAPYFLEYLRLWLKRWCETHRKPDGTPYNIYEDGLRIYTTIDLNMQKYAEQAVREHLTYLQKQFREHWKGRNPWAGNEDLLIELAKQLPEYKQLVDSGLTPQQALHYIKSQKARRRIFTFDGDRDTLITLFDSLKWMLETVQAGLLSVDVRTGQIRAWVGGPDWQWFKYDHVMAKRQVGSAFKPVVYAVAVESGWSPCHEIPNMPVIFEDFNNWSPKNPAGELGSMFTMVQGLAYSLNIVTAYIIKHFKPQAAITMARRLGITSDIPPYPSIALGTPEISLYEMVGAFNAIARKGLWIEPHFIIRIEDRTGNILYQHIPEEKRALSEKVAETMIVMMQQVVNRGTAVRLRLAYGFKGAIAGKTGTTQEHADGWFIGFTPQLTTGVWVGWEYRVLHFRSLELGQGARMALPIWALYMQKVYADTTLEYTEEVPFELNHVNTGSLRCLREWRGLRETLEGDAAEKKPLPGAPIF